MVKNTYWLRLLNKKVIILVAVVVTQLVEQLLPIPEVHGSNPLIGKNLNIYCIEKTKIQEKEAGNGPFFKKVIILFSSFASWQKYLSPIIELHKNIFSTLLTYQIKFSPWTMWTISCLLLSVPKISICFAFRKLDSFRLVLQHLGKTSV